LDLRKEEDRRRIKSVSKTLYAFGLTYGKRGRKVGSEAAIEGPFSGEKAHKQMRWANDTAPLQRTHRWDLTGHFWEDHNGADAETVLGRLSLDGALLYHETKLPDAPAAGNDNPTT
jgi:hypothetical protein